MVSNMISKLLEIPAVYKISQWLLAPGAHAALNREIKDLFDSLPAAKKILDVGCGPESWLWAVEAKPLGLDYSGEYIKDFQKRSEAPGVVASSATIPFRSESFDSVWSLGLLHHLTNQETKKTINEMARVLKPGGHMVVFDGVYPQIALLRPIAWLLRKNDRGVYMRRQEELETLLPDADQWRIRRLTYSLFGHEGLFCVYEKGVAPGQR